jgi:hypothetical protein
MSQSRFQTKPFWSSQVIIKQSIKQQSANRIPSEELQSFRAVRLLISTNWQLQLAGQKLFWMGKRCQEQGTKTSRKYV